MNKEIAERKKKAAEQENAQQESASKGKQKENNLKKKQKKVSKEGDKNASKEDEIALKEDENTSKDENSPEDEDENADVFHMFDDDEPDLLFFPDEDDPFKQYDFTIRSTDHPESDASNAVDTPVSPTNPIEEPEKEPVEEPEKEPVEEPEKEPIGESIEEPVEESIEEPEKEPSALPLEYSMEFDPFSAQSVEQLSDASSQQGNELPPELPSLEDITERSPEDNENPLMDYLDDLYNYPASQTIHFYHCLLQTFQKQTHIVFTFP